MSDFKKTENVINNGLKSIENVTNGKNVKTVKTDAVLEEPKVEETITETPVTEPVIEPTVEPTPVPTVEPIVEPTLDPTPEPTPAPTEEPSEEPATGDEPSNEETTAFINAIKKLTYNNNYSYLNCYGHIKNSYTVESIRKFYEEFKFWGIRSKADSDVINLCKNYFAKLDKPEVQE